MDKERELGLLDRMVLNDIRKADDVLSIVAAETGRVSKLYEDGGKLAAFGRELFTRARRENGIQSFTDADDLKDEISKYFDVCLHFKVPITLSGLSMWLSVTQPTFERWAAKKEDPRGAVCALAKEAIHFINEGLALEGDMNPILYMYQNKAYHGYIETTRVEFDVTGTDRLSESEIDEVLNLHLGEDGVYREARHG